MALNDALETRPGMPTDPRLSWTSVTVRLVKGLLVAHSVCGLRRRGAAGVLALFQRVLGDAGVRRAHL